MNYDNKTLEEDHIGLILNASGDGVYGVNSDGLTIFVNPAAVRMCGFTPDEMIGRSPHELTHHSHADGRPYPVSDCPVYAAFRDGEVHHVDDEVFWRKDGTCFPVEYVSTPIISDGNIVGAVLSFRDITKRKAAEAALDQSRARERQLQSDLQHASRLSAMDQMASGLAHELNQPLTAILSYLSAAKRYIGSNVQSEISEALPLVEKASDQAQRADKIIRGLRQFVLKGEGVPKPEDIDSVLREAVDLAIVGTQDQDIIVSLDCEKDLPRLPIERIRIQQVVINLIKNASEAIGEAANGRIEVLSRRHSDRGVEIVVSDNGPGLSEEVKGRLFQSFVTSKQSGMGIGLSICRSIIEDHGGDLLVEEKDGKGMTFRFILPFTNGVANS